VSVTDLTLPLGHTCAVIYAGALVVGQESSPLAPFLNAGVLGAVALVFILGMVVPAKLMDRETARADRAEADRRAMLDDYKAVVPVLERAINAIQASDADRQAQVQREADMRVLLREVRDALTRGRPA